MKKQLIIFVSLLLNVILAECSDLGYVECLNWPDFCKWNENAGQCQDIGDGSGGTGDGTQDGPYEYAIITESQGLRNGPDYKDGVLYYPINANPPYKSIVLTPGWGSGSSSMAGWAEFYASHGFIAMRIGPNDEINDSHEQRGEGLLDGIETIKQENNRFNSALFGLIDIDGFAVSGYSMGGGAAHDAAMMDGSIKALISLNPTVLFEDCNLCPAEIFDGVTYCFCLVPELIDHSIPSLIFTGEIEVTELPDYEGMLGQDIYVNMPESTDKILFEGAGDGHGFAAYPQGEVAEYALNWLNYHVLNQDACESLLEVPSSSSQYLTNMECTDNVFGDINGDSLVNIQDIILTINLVLNSEYDGSADFNSDDTINILDVITLVNIILNS